MTPERWEKVAMTPERWQKVKLIFQSALERAPGERYNFVSDACGGDDALRKEVESLIASHERSGEFIDSPAYEAGAKLIVDDNAALNSGQTIGSYEIISFTFLGYTFRPRKALHKNRKGSFTGFLPGVSAEKLTEMSRKAQAWKLNRRTTLTLVELAKAINPVSAGWLAYFTRFYPTAVIPLCKRINRHLVRWAKRKYKRLERSGKRAWAWLAAVVERAPRLFAHWKYCATA